MDLDINAISKEYTEKNILVIGDIILDAYIYGKIDRISQEAPVPIVAINHKDFKPGGAANVALNLIGLGANVTLIGVAGNDSDSKNLRNCFASIKKINIQIIECVDRPTSIKTRVIANGRQIARLDSEATESISNQYMGKVKERFDDNCNDIDGIIIEDYNKGLLNKELIEYIIKYSKKNEIPVYVDPKYDNYDSYKGVRFFKPNSMEYNSIAKEENFGHLPDSGLVFKEYMKSEILLLTLGSDGMSLYYDGKYHSIQTKARKVFDVSGAGDTVIATFAINDLCGLDPLDSSLISNLAAGRVCEEIGVYPITIESLKEIFSHHHN